MNQMKVNASIDMILCAIVTPVLLVATVALLTALVASLVEAGSVSLSGASTWTWSPAPLVVRRLAYAACGLTLVAGPATAVTTGGTGPATGDRHTCPQRCDPRLDGLRLPDLPATGRPAIVVHRGDCLWTIAEERLDPAAGDRTVVRLVEMLYQRNRSLIGPDPDLILPGTRLRAPEAAR